MKYNITTSQYEDATPETQEVFRKILRSLTAKPPRHSTQRQRNIYEAATRLLANLEAPDDGKCPECKNDLGHWYTCSMYKK